MGIFQVLKKNDKFVIVYVEKGNIEYLDAYNFEHYDVAIEYLESHRDDLTKVISDRKEEERKKEEERIAREKEAEEKRRKEEEAKQAEKEEKERKKREKKEAKEKKKQKRKEKAKKFWGNWKRFIAGFLAAVMFLVSGHFIGVLFSNWFGKKNDGKSQKPTSSTIGSTTPTKGISNTISQDDFEKLVEEYSKKYTDNSIDLTKEDLVKFVSIVNIDELLEENPEFALELFGTQTFEAYMDDAMDVFAATYGHNYMTHAKEGTTENFIWVSDCVYGSQKDKMLIVEEYVRLIADARGNSEEVNKLVTELLGRLASGDLTNLDSGVRFGMNVYLELIRSYLAKDELTKENFDELTTIVEMNLNNIQAEYNKCTVSKQTTGVMIKTTVPNTSMARPVKNPYKGVARTRTMNNNFNHRQFKAKV